MSEAGQRELALAEKLARRLTVLDRAARLPAAVRIFEAWSPEDLAGGLRGLLERREQGDARARETLVVVTEAILELGERDEISNLLAYTRAHHLSRVSHLLERPPPARTFRVEEETGVDLEMREQTLGYRKALARTANREQLVRLLFDPDPEVVRRLLTHPKLVEGDVVTLAARRPARPAILLEISRSPRWKARRRVQRALANNPFTPTEIALKLVALLPLTDARELAADPNLHDTLRLAAQTRVTRADEEG